MEYHDVFKSPSLRGRGLKLILTLCAIINVSVALFARAWIEISAKKQLECMYSVALFARAWIEMA